jgi:hypothetical protein
MQVVERCSFKDESEVSTWLHYWEFLFSKFSCLWNALLHSSSRKHMKRTIVETPKMQSLVLDITAGFPEEWPLQNLNGFTKCYRELKDAASDHGRPAKGEGLS